MEHLEEVCRDITSDDYICVMTRGHQHDFLVEKQILRTPASYIGVIGSRKEGGGLCKTPPGGVYRPGSGKDQDADELDIQAETPAEIASALRRR